MPQHLVASEGITGQVGTEEIETEKKNFEEAQLAKRAKEESEANSRKMERLRLLRERGGMTQEEAAVHIQGLWRTREARKMMSLMMHQVFEKVWDPATGQCYYHNKRTGESSWVKPTVFGDHDDLEIATYAHVKVWILQHDVMLQLRKNTRTKG